MISPRLPLLLLGQRLAVCRLHPDYPVPDWTRLSRAFLTVSTTPTELSIVAIESVVPGDVRAERGYRALVVKGELPQDLIGVFASMAGPLAEAGIPIFAISTFDTDYVLVKEQLLEQAIGVLETAGHVIDRGFTP